MPSVIGIADRKASLDNNYCLVLTSNSVEKKAVNDVILNAKRAHIGQMNQGAYLGLVGDFLVVHLAGQSGISHDQSIGRIASTFLRSQNMPRPRLVLLVGFCWRNPKSTPDEVTIVSPTVHCANIQHALLGGRKTQVKVQNSPISIDNDQAERLCNTISQVVGRTMLGPIASAETLYKDDDLRDQLIKQIPGIIGGEMEGFAFLAPFFPWLVLKAASDTGGTDFDRVRQATAAANAARAILPAMVELERIGAIKVEDVARNAPIRDLVEGDVIEFDARRLRTEELNDHLDGFLGPQIEYRLRRYISSDGYDLNFLRHAVDAFLELAQNAVRYGKANAVRFRFALNEISITDDGDHFDPRTLVGMSAGRGGARAIQRFLEREAAGEMAFEISAPASGGGNIYSISLPLANAAIDQARRVCAVHVIENVIGIAHGRPTLFEFDPTCKTLYLDTTQVRMSSRKYTLADEVKALAAQGKRIFVGCADEEDLLLFKEEFREVPSSQVTVFVDARLSGPGGLRD